MKCNWIPLLFLAGALAAPAAVSGTAVDGPKPDEVVKLKVGSTVPKTVALMDFEGESTSFEDLRGKVVLLHFWSDRCPAERHANPVFMEMEKRYAGNKDVVMVGIAANQNELGAVPEKGADLSEHYTSLRKKRDKVGYKHTILADHGNVVSGLFQARSTPHCFVIDKKGVIQYAGALDDDPRGRKGADATNYLVDAAAAILAGEELPVTETKPYG
jgi:thiol-disulfide isomerase/thioredoxin